MSLRILKYNNNNNNTCSTPDISDTLIVLFYFFTYLPRCHRNSRHMGWHGYWASPGDWQTQSSPGHQRNCFPVSMPVHSSAAGECGLLPQDALILLKSCLSAPKVLHTLRRSPSMSHPSLQLFDSLLRSALQRICNSDFSDSQWLQASHWESEK